MLTVSDLQRSAKLAWFLSEIDKNCNEYLPDVSKEIQKLIDMVYEECYIGMVEAVNMQHLAAFLYTSYLVQQVV